MRRIGIALAALFAFSALAQDRASRTPAEVAKDSGCFECHSVDKDKIGPAWRKVAERYRKDDKARERLIEVVRNGGKGNWMRVSRGVPMPPHAPRLSTADIALLVDWIVSLGGGKQ